MKKPIVIVTLLAVAGLAFAATLHSQDAPPTNAATQPADAAAIVTRVYDIRSLLIDIPDYLLDESQLPGLQAEKSQQPEQQSGTNIVGAQWGGGTSQDRLDSIIKLVTVTVDPDSWRDAGGNIGSITELQGQLIIVQTPAAQEQVRKLLADMSATQLKTVRISATWLLLTDAELQSIRESSPPPDAKEAGDPITRVDSRAMAKFTPYCHAETLAINGQTVHIASGVEQRYVSNYSVYPGDHPASQPIVSTAFNGVALQSRVNLIPPAQTALLTLWEGAGEVTGLPATQPAGAANQPAVNPPAMTHPRALGQHAGLAAQIPLNTDVLIRGMTLDPADHTEPKKSLYLVMRVEAR